MLPQLAADSVIHWSIDAKGDSKLVILSADAGKSITVTGQNATNHAEYLSVKAEAANGFYVTSHIYVEPKYIDPPTFARQPAIGVPADGRLP